MNDAQSAYGTDDASVEALADAAFGRCLSRLLPEDIFDRQPLSDAERGLLFVADARIDNRDAVERMLGIHPPDARTMSDSALLFRAWVQWDETMLQRVVGDFAFGCWNERKREVIIARDPLGQRPLHYWEGGGGFAFASMPGGLHALGIERAPDQRELAGFLADLPPVNGRIGFRHITAVPAGHVLKWTPQGARCRRYWDPSPRELRLKDEAEYVEAYREQLDQAVRSRLRGCGGLVATQLSAGYDSSAVTATAARLLLPEAGSVLAFTAAPRAGFDGPVPRGRIADESGIAAATAALHPNVEHVVVRPDGASPFDHLAWLHRHSQYPGGHICNHVWWTAIERRASERGARVLLTGEQGNLTISAGGLAQLADLLRQGKWLTWAREARAAPAGMGVTWKGVLGASFGPWVSQRLWRRLAARYLTTSPRNNQPFLLAEPLRSEMMLRNRREARDARPPRSSIARRLDLLKRADQGSYRKASLAKWGIDERDPTADTRLIDFCLSLPGEQLLRNGVRRPLAQRALGDRLPLAVLEPRARGYQMADWYEQITKTDVLEYARKVAACPAAAALIDLKGVFEMIERWPEDGWERFEVITEYRGALLRALDAAGFAAWAEGSRPEG